MNFLKLLFCVCFLQLFSNEATIEILKGDQVISYLPRLAELRISFFRNYPYLYDGNLTDEEQYLSAYARSENSLFAVAKEGDEIVGLLTGIPILECDEVHKSPWIERENSNVFYLGEVVLADGYQASDLQEKLYQRFENALLENEIYDAIVVCEIERDEVSKKTNMPSSEMLWDERGFIRHPEINAHFSWKDVGDLEESDHFMVYWKKSL